MTGALIAYISAHAPSDMKIGWRVHLRDGSVVSGMVADHSDSMLVLAEGDAKYYVNPQHVVYVTLFEHT